MSCMSLASCTAFVSVRDGYRCCATVTQEAAIARTTRFLIAEESLSSASAWTTSAAAEATTTTTTTTTTFEPVLNVPAFGAFFFIAIIFSFLQYRIAAIGDAAERRTDALTNLRHVKSLQVAGEAISEEEIERAKAAYKEALEEVERLRTVIPGFARIAPPPSESENRQRMEENVAAAKQFLDMDISSTLPPKVDDKEKKGLSPVLVGVLGIVGVSQIALLFLFVFGPQSPPTL